MGTDPAIKKVNVLIQRLFLKHHQITNALNKDQHGFYWASVVVHFIFFIARFWEWAFVQNLSLTELYKQN